MDWIGVPAVLSAVTCALKCGHTLCGHPPSHTKPLTRTHPPPCIPPTLTQTLTQPTPIAHRLFWSDDERFLKQFKPGSLATKFKSYSKFPPCLKDMAFWVSPEFTENNLCELVRGAFGCWVGCRIVGNKPPKNGSHLAQTDKRTMLAPHPSTCPLPRTTFTQTNKQNTNKQTNNQASAVTWWRRLCSSMSSHTPRRSARATATASHTGVCGVAGWRRA